jgi:phage virion morphogenesis protein
MTMHVDDARLQLDLSGMQQRCSDTGPFLEAVGVYMMGSVGKNFEQEQSPQGEGWKGLADATKLGRTGRKSKAKTRAGKARFRAKKLGAGHKILQDTGNMRGSISPEVSGDAVRIGPSWELAAVHQFGTNRAGRGHHTTILARPFLGFRPEDPEAIEGMARDHIEGKLGLGRPML